MIAPAKLCECGCGQRVNQRFALGHQARGVRNWHYRGGRAKSHGYIRLLRATGSGQRDMEHKLIAERILGRPLPHEGQTCTCHRDEQRPAANKFHVGNGADGKHYWLTPPDLYAKLDAEFGFTFDPCPYPLPAGFDGLTGEWGERNYVNPPFGSIVHEGRKKGPTAWVRKAIEEHRKGKLVVLVYPLDKWVLMLLSATGTEVRNLGDVRWLAIEDRQPGKGTGRHIACFVLRP